MANYELWLCRDDGARLTMLEDTVNFAYNRVLHDVGSCEVVMPSTFPQSWLAVDRRIEIWRQPVSGPLRLERSYFLRKWRDKTNASGVRTIALVGFDANYLLKGRTVAAQAASAQADMTDEADDMCKEIVRDSMGADADAARQWTTYVSVRANAGAGPSLTKGFSRRNVLSVLKDLANAAEAAGTPIYWDLVEVGTGGWEFVTSTSQPGIDHSYPGGIIPVHLGIEHGNLYEPSLEHDYSEEVTYAYAGGQGEEAARVIQTAEDTARSGRSLFGRREGFADARNEDTTAGVLAEARRMLNESRPRLRFTATILDTTGCRYGVHWRFGDKLTAYYAGQSFQCIVRAVNVSVDSRGAEGMRLSYGQERPSSPLVTDWTQAGGKKETEVVQAQLEVSE